MIHHKEKSILQLGKVFELPPMEYRPVPFWHINGKLTKDGITKQISEAIQDSGFGGVAVLPVTKIEPAYLSEEYFVHYKEILQLTEQMGGQVILYDDIDFPSGTAGGKLIALHPEDGGKRLDKSEVEVEGPCQVEMPISEKYFLGAVAMHAVTKERVSLRECISQNSLKWNVPEGRWIIMQFYCVPQEGKPGNLVDYMDGSSVQRFMTLTYEEYAKRYSAYFGKLIKMCFYDDIGYFRAPRTWTSRYNEKFIDAMGYDPIELYPALWYDIGPETDSARVTLFGFRAELLAEGYPKLVAEWAQKHGLKSTGHPPGNYDPCPVDMNLDIFKFYRHSHIPLMDYIFYHGHGRNGFKLVSSAANVYDRTLVAAEIYGAFNNWDGKDFDVKMMYRAGMEVFARGVNLVIPHGMWYDPSQVRIPPLISPDNPKLSADLPDYNLWAARHCLLLQGGRHIADIAVVYPIATLEAWYHFDPPGGHPPWGQFVPPNSDYLKVSEMLSTEIRQDFTFLHPSTIQNQCIVQDQSLILNNVVNRESYKIIILPSCKVIEWETLQKIKNFYDQGGIVITTTQLPQKSAELGFDQAVLHIIDEMFDSSPKGGKKVNSKGGMSFFIPELVGDKLRIALREAQPVPDVNFLGSPKVNSGNGVMSYLHKVNDDHHLYLFANSSDDDLCPSVQIRGHLSLQKWDPLTGLISDLSSQHLALAGNAVTQFELQLSAVTSIFVVGK